VATVKIKKHTEKEVTLIVIRKGARMMANLRKTRTGKPINRKHNTGTYLKTIFTVCSFRVIVSASK
jgi:hypothetical protein